MRTISATLEAAQQSRHRLPYVEAEVHDFEQGVKRLTWTRLYTGAEPASHHDIAIDGQGSMHRIRVQSNNLYHQKVTSPGPASDFSTWTSRAADCDGPCAIAAQGAKVYIFYRKTDNTLRKLYSHDYGASWTNAQLVAYTDVLFMAAAWWGTTEYVVCFALRSNEINGIALNSNTQATYPHTWQDGTHPLTNTYGIGATFNTTLSRIEIVLAGKESDTPYNHYNLFRGLFLRILTTTWAFQALASFLMSPDGENFVYEYPDCHLPASPQSYETTRVTAVENFSGIAPYIRPLTCHIVRGTYWEDVTFTEPKPFLDLAPTTGLRLSTDDSFWWMEQPGGVWRAPRPADSPLILRDDIISLKANSRAVGEGLPSHSLTITLDNSKGQYATPPRERSEVLLKLGYRTTAGNETSEAGVFWVDGWEWTHDSGLSTFRLFCIDGWGLMNRWTARYQMRWNKDAVDPTRVWAILYQLLARAGILLTDTPVKPKSFPLDNFYPDFSVAPGTPGKSAMGRVLSFVPDILVFRGREAFTKNPLPGEASSYAYGADHPIIAGSYSEYIHASRARAIGRDAAGARVLHESLDWDLVHLVVDILDQDYDPNLDVIARAEERADAMLRRASLGAIGGQIVVPTNVGQELLDVVEITDPRCGISAQNCRIMAMETDFNRQKGTFQQKLVLQAP